MSFNFLVPVSEELFSLKNNLPKQTLGQNMPIHSETDGIPNLNNVQIALLGVRENRNAIKKSNNELSFKNIREALYKLYPGNWNTKIADLGDIKQGASVEDTHYAFKTIMSILHEKAVIPIILGGSQDLTYSQYRSYDNIIPMVNIVNIDVNFDLGDPNLPMTNNSYVSKIIADKPFNLFNYTTIGYQTYFNNQEEIDLMEKLYFEAYRLGELSENLNVVEPLLRDADIVSVDLKSIKASEVSEAQRFSPNGLSGKEICTIARYSGISNKVSSFGVFEYQQSKDDFFTAMLTAQILWYFIEGVNYRVKDDIFFKKSDFQKFNVITKELTLKFYKSLKTERWWIEIPFLTETNNKLKNKAFLPCTNSDYYDALKGEIPMRWHKACKKNNF